ncbi:MAG: branched-chain amino acid ABC transporter permease [Betaproteobacteria bacterium]|nr:branched-chain amino acid ABC transporter permease [Betaproteobacteria bacterium]
MSRKLIAAVGVGVLAIAALCLPAFVTGYVIYIANITLVYIVLSLGLHILTGEAGQFALSHAASYGIGIYTAAILNKLAWGVFPLPILAGGLVAGLLGLLVGLVALRMRDIYLALATFAFGQAMQWVFLNWKSVTGGPNGTEIHPTGLFHFDIMSDKQAYPLVLTLTALLVVATLLLSRSRLGSALRAVRESEVAALAVGVNVRQIKLTAFVLSGVYAGLAGGIFTLFSTFIGPDSLGFQTTIFVLTMIVVGGLGSVAGAISGAVIMSLSSEALRSALSYQEIIYGVLLMGFMMYASGGILDLGRRLWRRGSSPVNV